MLLLGKGCEYITLVFKANAFVTFGSFHCYELQFLFSNTKYKIIIYDGSAKSKIKFNIGKIKNAFIKQ